MSALELLFEIGTEELPPGEIVPALQALEAHLVARCRDNRLAIGAVRTYATPRRLAVVVSDVAPRGEDAEELAMGPSAKAAFDADGNPSKAALGFARSRGVDIDAIERVDTPRGEYIAARIRQEGRPAAQVLTEALNAAFAAIPWKRSMRWGWADESFSRPVHWIVALLGGAVLPVSFAGIDAGDLTRGHRFLAPDPLRVTDAAQWQRALLDAKVVVDLDARRDAVREGVRATVTAAGLRPLLDEDLVEEVVHLVEWPVPLLGRFPEELLEVPREVLITSMKTHQRYFAAEDTDGALANAFCFISNMVVPDPAVVVAGNLRVLRARLEDARFFGVKVGAAGEGGCGADGLACQRARQCRGGFVFRYVVHIEAGGGDGGDACLLQQRDIGAGEDAALLEGFGTRLLRMGENRAFGLVRCQFAEDHVRSVSVISAMMEVAISAGLFAPMLRPTGPWMRAMSRSAKPASVSRAMRAAWVFFEPRAPT